METFTITLDEDEYNYVRPLNQVVHPDDVIKFQTSGGAFSILIRNAINFLDIQEQDLKILLNNVNPESKSYTVKKVDADINREYTVYCITQNNWPDAPPRIIVVR